MKLKQYKLKRDLPTFKAGSEFILCCGNLIEVKTDDTLGVCAYSGSTLKKFPNILTDWFEEIKPAEPLVKDKKVRKAVRAWAEANEVLEVFIDRIGDGTYIELYDEDDGRRRISTLRPVGLKIGEAYTIDELCGEEGE